VPQLSGRFKGTENGQLSFAFSGDGEIGVTPDLQVEVRDASGLLVATVNVGAGYEPGTAVDLGNGISLELSHGTVVAGESFETPVVATSDESGVLTALGLNTFFVGDDPHNLAVDPRLLQDPDALATAQSAQPGDVRNLSALIAQRDLQLFDGETLTAQQFVGRLISDVGSQVQTLDQTQQNLELLQQSIAAQQASISGVDPNEEAIRMLQYQEAFQAAARYLDVVNQTTQELFRILD
jgi:flagellar hook-associated protein FlgK